MLFFDTKFDFNRGASIRLVDQFWKGRAENSIYASNDVFVVFCVLTGRGNMGIAPQN